MANIASIAIKLYKDGKTSKQVQATGKFRSEETKIKVVDKLLILEQRASYCRAFNKEMFFE